MPLIVALAVLAPVSGIVTIAGQMQDRRRLVYVSKPLATLLILLIALLARAPVTPFYRGAFVAGLAFSLAGDVFLMLPQRFFLPGLASFLVAHLWYGAGLLSALSGPVSPWRYLPFLAYAAGLYLYLRPHLSGHRVPVLAYALVITAMAWLALERHVHAASTSSLLALVGALFFVASDSALAINRFAIPFRRSPIAVLGSYYAAQLLLALSV